MNWCYKLVLQIALNCSDFVTIQLLEPQQNQQTGLVPPYS